ncbi:DUF222 domain-containing protein [Cellulomonas hominis]
MTDTWVEGAELAEVVERLGRSVADPASWEASARRAALRGLDQVMARLATVRARLLVAERDAGQWSGAGASSFAVWRGSSSGSGRGVAAREERQAEALVSMPTVAKATEAGEIGLAHVDVIARVAQDRSEKVRAAAATPAGQAELVDLASRQDASSFARAAARWAATQDADALERTHQAQRRERFLHLSSTAEGTRISGRLDAQAGYRLRLALEAASPRPAADDDRSAEQRAADALTAIAEHVLTDPATQPGAAVRPHVSFIMREATWDALRGRRGRRSDDAAGGGLRAEGAQGGAAWDGGERPEVGCLDSASSVLMEDGTPVARSEAEQALCDCELTRIVVDAADVPVNLGRTTRLYTAAMRRAVINRDRSCRWAGCDRPARWSEIHHIRWWERDGGDTSLSNGVLLCSFHHHEVHARDLDVVRVAPPPWRGRRRRGLSGGAAVARAPGDRPGQGDQATPVAGSGSMPASMSHQGSDGGALYRFFDPRGRLVAGPPLARAG